MPEIISLLTRHMFKTITILALAALGLSACKPTPRTARPRNLQQTQETQQPAEPADASSTTEEQATPTPAAPESTTPAPADQQDEAASEESALLTVQVTRQAFNRLTPWEKQAPAQARLCGTYLGNGLVLTYGKALTNTTYAELSLPDGTRTVPARIVSYDYDLGLGLLTVANEADASIFDTRTACQLGEPLQKNNTAELWCTLNGSESHRVPLKAQTGGVSDSMPRLILQADTAVPEGFTHGAPIMRDGKLAGMSAGYESAGRNLSIINAEILRRFLNRHPDTPTGAPVLGIRLAALNDPAFRRYLKLQDNETGVYISEVEPASAAAEAGLQVGDVITALEGMNVDDLGRCDLPIYGMTHISAASRYLRPIGDNIRLTISRGGESQEITVPLNTTARDNTLIPEEDPDTAPRYIVWGGLVFQPLTNTYLQALKSQARGTLPTEFLRAQDAEKELSEQGYKELTALTLIIPTPATLGYDTQGFCVVEKVNGRIPHNFAEFANLLDEPTPNGIVEIAINKAPYTIYLDRATAEAVNDTLRRSAVPNLRRVE